MIYPNWMKLLGFHVQFRQYFWRMQSPKLKVKSQAQDPPTIQLKSYKYLFLFTSVLIIKGYFRKIEYLWRKAFKEEIPWVLNEL